MLTSFSVREYNSFDLEKQNHHFNIEEAIQCNTRIQSLKRDHKNFNSKGFFPPFLLG